MPYIDTCTCSYSTGGLILADGFMYYLYLVDLNIYVSAGKLSLNVEKVQLPNAVEIYTYMLHHIN